MSYISAVPEVLTSAATALGQVGSTLNAANLAAAVPTTAVLAQGADEVSAAVATLFAGHAQEYQALSTRLDAFHQQFVAALSSAGRTYAAAEAASANPLQSLLAAINAPTETLLGRPLIGNGHDGTAAHPNGQAGGLLFGNGGNGYSQTGNTGVAGGNGGRPGWSATARRRDRRNRSGRRRRWERRLLVRQRRSRRH
ncbi:PE family protein, partial [Mycobacterium szulgai]